MSDLFKDEAENFSSHVTNFKQREYIKIETLCCNTVPIIHTLLKAISKNAVLDGSTVQQLHKHYREGRVSTEDNPQSSHHSKVINNISIGIVTQYSTVLEYTSNECKNWSWHIVPLSHPLSKAHCFECRKTTVYGVLFNSYCVFSFHSTHICPVFQPSCLWMRYTT